MIIGSKSGTLMLSLICEIGRPISDGAAFSSLSTFGVNLRNPRLRSSMTVGIRVLTNKLERSLFKSCSSVFLLQSSSFRAVSYTHLRAHETRHDLVCRL